MKNKFLLLAATFFMCIAVQAQAKYKTSDYKKKPIWIQMMKDPSANYNETVKAFREFFKERALPKEPGEVEGSDAFEKQVGLEDNDGDKKSEKERERELKKRNPNEPSYAFEVRAFKGWFYETKPWVRADGTIISKKERQAIVDKQQQELKATEKANGKN